MQAESKILPGGKSGFLLLRAFLLGLALVFFAFDIFLTLQIRLASLL
jgi:hypothetical protein